MEPGYHIPRGLVLQVLWAGLMGKPRELREEAQAFVRGIHPPPLILGEECIPKSGPFLLLMNHYCRPGFAVWWLALSISSRLGMPHTWVSASEWTAPDRWYGPMKTGVSGWIFGRLAKVYGLLSMPPMPPNPREAERRAAAVRRVLTYVERQPEAVVCMAPEGRDVGRGRLGWPTSGAGRFISLLAARGLQILPVGGWEEGGTLVIRFGEPYRLEPIRAAGEREGTDKRMAEAVMRSIARLLPEDMRGEFG